ncbi:ATL2.2 family protein [Megaselia abdita]
MWSEVFLYDKGSEKIAIILLDTQGVFDNQTTVKENVGIFSLSTLLSSVQIYNIMHQIQEDDLQNLHLFTQYGRLASSEGEVSPLQDLVFLIRDWRFPYEYDFGFYGGDSFLKSCLEVRKEQASELQDIRKELSTCFDGMKCFLMANPGEKVSSDKHFDGRLNDIAPAFVDNLKDLVPKLLAPENLVVKRIGGTTITAAEFLTYLENYVTTFNKDDVINPKSLFQTTAEASQLNVIISAKDIYSGIMDKMSEKAMKPSLFEAEHLKAKATALQKFEDVKKIGSVEMTSTFLKQLEADIANLYKSNQKRNVDKFRAFVDNSNLIASSEIIDQFNNELHKSLKMGLKPEEFKTRYLEKYLKFTNQMKSKRLDGDEQFDSVIKKVEEQFKSLFAKQDIQNSKNFLAFVDNRNLKASSEIINQFNDELYKSLKMGLKPEEFKKRYLESHLRLTNQLKSKRIDGDKQFVSVINKVEEQFKSLFSKQDIENSENFARKVEDNNRALNEAFKEYLSKIESLSRMEDRIEKDNFREKHIEYMNNAQNIFKLQFKEGEGSLESYLSELVYRMNTTFEEYDKLNDEKNSFGFVSHVLLPLTGIIPGIAFIPGVNKSYQHWFGGPKI